MLSSSGEILVSGGLVRADETQAGAAPRPVRLQARPRRARGSWEPTAAAAAPFPPSGHPELPRTREGFVLHAATTGVSATDDGGATWTDLGVAGIPSYPRAVQTGDGRIPCVGHVGGDDGYDLVDQSIFGLSFALET